VIGFIRGWRVYPRVNRWSLDNFGVGVGSRLSYAVACAKMRKIRRTYLKKNEVEIHHRKVADI